MYWLQLNAGILRSKEIDNEKCCECSVQERYYRDLHLMWSKALVQGRSCHWNFLSRNFRNSKRIAKTEKEKTARFCMDLHKLLNFTMWDQTIIAWKIKLWELCLIWKRCQVHTETVFWFWSDATRRVWCLVCEIWTARDGGLQRVYRKALQATPRSAQTILVPTYSPLD